MKKSRIFHAFLWNYNDIKNNLLKIKQQGFTHIQIMPCQGTKDNGTEFWKPYQPLNLHITNSMYGTKKDLKSLCQEANELGICIVADVVLRLCASDERDTTKPHKMVNPNLIKFLSHNQTKVKDYNDREDYTANSNGLPIFDLENKEYQALCVDFLQELFDVGVRGIRIDECKHFLLPSENGTFISNVFEPFKGKLFMYGECIDLSDELLKKYYTETPIMPMTTWCNDKSVPYVICSDTHDLCYSWHVTDKFSDDQRYGMYLNVANNFNNAALLYFPHAWDNLVWEERICTVNNK